MSEELKLAITNLVTMQERMFVKKQKSNEYFFSANLHSSDDTNRMRTMVQSLMHKFIVEDATKCFTAMPDYVLLFTRKGENAVPVTHERGFTGYRGRCER